MTPSSIRELFTRDSGPHAFHGLMISRGEEDGGLFLLPLHEITWIAATPLEKGAGCVEIHTRQRLIRLGMSRMEVCRRFMELFLMGNVNRVTEGTGPPQAGCGGGRENQPATLAVEILDLEENEDGNSAPPAPSSPAAAATAARRAPGPGMGLGFPTF